MKERLFESEMDRQTIVDNLEASSINAEETEYMKPLTDDEVRVYNEKIVDNNLKIRAKEQEKKQFMEQFKLEMDPLKTRLNETLDIVKTRQIEKIGILYVIPNDQETMVGYYDETGRLIRSRPILPEEKSNVVSFKNAM